jgi:hypothetical protein
MFNDYIGQKHLDKVIVCYLLRKKFYEIFEEKETSRLHSE